MADHFLFADEAGDFNFTNSNRSSRFFILCSATMTNTDAGQELLELRRDLALEKHQNRQFLHASADPWPVRERVYNCLSRADFRIDATIYEKSKAHPAIYETQPDFYQHIWYYHLKYVLPRIIRKGDRILITGAALGKNKGKAAFKQAIHNSAQQVMDAENWEVAFVQSSEDPCLWLADYCGWAMQRKYELACEKAYEYISSKVRSEFNMFRSGTKHFY